MKTFKITKHFQGGCGIYFARMPDNKKMRQGCWNYQLSDWGKNTDGGHNYGWRIYANKTSRKPSKKLRYFQGELKFNQYYLSSK